MLSNYAKEKKQNEFLRNLLDEPHAISIKEYSTKHNISRNEIIQIYTVIKEYKNTYLQNDNSENFAIAVGKKAVVRDFLSEGGFIKIKKKDDADYWNSRLSVWISLAALLLSIIAILYKK